MEFGKSCWYDFYQGGNKEWIVTNGIGGYASLSLICSNSRRYHGLLVSALKPPTSRYLLLSNLLEDITFEDGTSESLSSFMTKGFNDEEYINHGFDNLTRATFDYIPEFVYSYENISIKKKISMKQGANTTIVLYDIRNGSRKAALKLTPLVNFRDHHHKSCRNNLNFVTRVESKQMIVTPLEATVNIRMEISEGQLKTLNNCYFDNMFYGLEQERGLDCYEDHFIPGFFNIELKPWECKTVSFTVSSENVLNSCRKEKKAVSYKAMSNEAVSNKTVSDRENTLLNSEKLGSDSNEATCCKQQAEYTASQIIAEQAARLEYLTIKAGYRHELLKRLVLAADNFIVYRKSTDAKTVIAGYPWFTDWGRDTMIAFTGLTLTTRRFEDAKEILFTFSKYVDYGLIPNMFPDDGEKPAYNSVDAALWYFEAVNSFLEYTGDEVFIKEEIYPSLKNIIRGFMNGTLFDIGMTSDGLITAGNAKTQLTWMDAKVGDWVVTPRHGKAVEINALWFNCLMIMSKLSQRFGEVDIYLEPASRAKAAFEKTFWNEEKQCLYDVVNEAGNDDSIRPNQILAVGLSFAAIDGHKAKRVLEKVWRELYTPYGLRTLSLDSPQYRGVYSGDVWSRDGAYHQGTVWTWLLGRFITAYVRVNGNTAEAREKACDFILPFADHIKDAGIGNISEIFDGSNPHYPRGCFAQAWSVAEILRAAVEDVGLK